MYLVPIKILGLSYITLDGGGGVVDTGHDLEKVYVSGPSVKSCRSIGLPECVRGDWKSLVQSLVQSATWNTLSKSSSHHRSVGFSKKPLEDLDRSHIGISQVEIILWITF